MFTNVSFGVSLVCGEARLELVWLLQIDVDDDCKLPKEYIDGHVSVDCCLTIFFASDEPIGMVDANIGIDAIFCMDVDCRRIL